MKEVSPANPFKENSLGSSGTASNMLVRQYQFPNRYEDNEKMEAEYSDYLWRRDEDYTRNCVEKHAGMPGEGILYNWIPKARDMQILNFIIDVLKSDKNVQYTGYRILATVDQSRGHVVWYFQLFAKDPNSTTKVYSELKAPNVIEFV